MSYEGEDKYYKKALEGLQKGRIYYHPPTDRFFFVKRFIESLEGQYFVEFYEIKYDSCETSEINSGRLKPLRKNNKRTYMEALEKFKESFKLH